MPILLLYALAGSAIANLAGLVGMYVGARLTGMPVFRVQLFIGPAIVRARIGGVLFSVGPIPIGAYITSGPRGEEATVDLKPQQVFAAFVACVFGPMVVALAILGINASIDALVSGLWQVPLGGVAFWSWGESLLDEARVIAEREGLWVIVGLFAAKSAAWNLLPLPTNNGGTLLLSPWKRREQLLQWLNLLSFLFGVAVAAGWIVAAVIGLIRWF